jgi:hypothetical protein
MPLSCRSALLVLPAIVFAFVGQSTLLAAQLLVADRLTNKVFRYDEDGTFLNVVLSDNINLNQPTGIAVSSDRTKLFVSSYQNGRVVSYDYNLASGTASNPTVFATANLVSPNAIRFSHDGNTMYVSNLGGSGVAQFNSNNGSSAGPPITGFVGEPFPGNPTAGDIFQFSGLEFAPTGELLVAGFQNFPGGNKGAIARSNAAITTISNFIGPSASLNGASGLLVHGDDLYVTGMFASNIQRFDAQTGQVDSSFLVSDLEFPQQLIAAPDGNGFLVGILGLNDGEGHIAHYDFDGDLVGDGKFAENVSVTGVGFTEATAFTVITSILPGDFNNDEDVDAEDLVVWQQNYGDAGNAPYLLGDGDADGDTDGRDFLIWQRNYGAVAPLSDSLVASVPEPSMAVFFLTTLISLGVRFRA